MKHSASLSMDFFSLPFFSLALVQVPFDLGKCSQSRGLIGVFISVMKLELLIHGQERLLECFGKHSAACSNSGEISS